MTQSNNPSGSKAPGFGAFIGSDGPDNNSASSEQSAPKTRQRSRRKPKEAAPEGDADSPRASTRGGQRKKATRRRTARADEAAPAESDAGEATGDTPAPRARTRRTRKPAAEVARETDAPAESGSEPASDEAPRRRSRGTRSRRPRAEDEREESREESRESRTESPPSDQQDEERSSGRSRGRGSRGGRQRSGRGREDDDSQSEESPESAEREDEGSDSSEERPRRKRSRGGRGRSRKRSTETQASEAAEVEHGDDDNAESSRERESSRDRPARRTKSPRGRRSGRAEQDQADVEETRAASSEDAGDGDHDSDDDQPKRRRRGSRGSRGGRGRTKKVVGRRERPGAAVVEFIPGEEDDLPELPDLPDDAELLNEDDIDSGSGRKRSGRKRAASDETDVDDRRVARKAAQIKPDRKILVNACDKEETRVAVVRDGKILDFQMNVESDTSLVNDIYRGRIVNIEHSIGAAFVDFGRGRNGFLHTSDVLPTYADAGASLSKLLSTSVDPEDWDSSSGQPGVSAELHHDDEDDDEDHDGDGEDEDEGSSRGKKKTGRRKRATKGKGGKDKGRQKRFRARPRTPIDALFKVGQKVVVQITKDAIGDKGPTLTTYLSIPGRYLVLMPSISHSGVSRKIEDVKERKRLKRILESLNVPEGMGVIARTATMGHTKAEIKRDLDYLLSAWNQLAKRLEQGHGPAALYQESDVAIRTVRDLFGPETEAVLVDEPEAYKSIRDFAELLMPEHADRIIMYDGARPLFHAEGVEQDFEKIFSRRIELPSGGSIVFDQAEALVAIDVNSGKTRTASHDFEEIALKTNMEAVPEIARQIRLRDLGGIIVVDFIDMMKNSNRKLVEQTFRGRFSDDRARSKVGRVSQFGLLEMTRQRLGPGMSKKLFKPCVACRGAGRQRTESSRSAAILRRLGSALTLKGFTTVELKAHPETIEYLKTVRTKELNALESSSGRTLELKPVVDQIEDSVLRYLRTDGREVRPGGRRKR